MLKLNRKSQISYERMRKLGIDPWIIELLQKVLEKSPKERYSAEEALQVLRS